MMPKRWACAVRSAARRARNEHKQRPKGGIPEGGPIPKHRDTTIYIYIHI